LFRSRMSMTTPRSTDHMVQSSAGDAATGHEVVGLLRDGRLVTVPSPDEEARTSAQARLDELSKPPGSLAELETLGARLAAMTGRIPPWAASARFSFAGGSGLRDDGDGLVTIRLGCQE